TIDGVRTVIDSGYARVAGYDPQRGLDRLELSRISKASATQRAGRAGRTAPGRCIRLWTAKEHHALDDFELPEIRRGDLCGTAQGSSDVLIRLDALAEAERQRFGPSLRDRGIDAPVARNVVRLRDDLERIARNQILRVANQKPETTDVAIQKLTLLAYPDRVARRRGQDPAAAVVVGGGGVRLAAESVVRKPEFFVAVDARHDQRSAKSE